MSHTDNAATPTNRDNENAQIDALGMTRALRERLTDFSLEAGYLRRRDLSEIARRVWAGPCEQGGLISDMWLEAALPAQSSGDSTDSLVREGAFPQALCEHLNRVGEMPRDRLLYTHQARAVREARNSKPGERPALVVTAGTGAGKTESFLLPLLADLWTLPDADVGDGHGGVRAILLYPMNALVNDQVGRLQKWLGGQKPHDGPNPVTFFHFTGETPEDGAAASRENIEPYRDPCRLRTRKQARGWETATGTAIKDVTKRGLVPDILVTNYSMLEYMLTRPQDAVFFGPALRTIVVDEAHLYSGTLAAEVSLLLQRVLLRCGKTPGDVLHIATSATLGGNENDLRKFAGELFRKEPAPETVRLIQGQSRPLEWPAPQPPLGGSVLPTAMLCDKLAREPILSFPTMTLNTNGDAVLVRDTAACGILKDRLAPLVSASALEEAERLAGDAPAVFLYHALSAAPLVQQIGACLRENNWRMPLATLAHALWGEDSRGRDAAQARAAATVTLLQAASAARLSVGEYPLVPHRLHLLARPSSGLSVCINPLCMGPDDRKVAGLGALQTASGDLCVFCQSPPMHVLTLLRCSCCGEALLAGFGQADGVYRTLGPRDDLSKVRVYALPPLEEPATEASGSEGAAAPRFHMDPETGKIETAGVALSCMTRCPTCDSAPKDWELIAAAPNLALSIAAETALAQGTPFPAKGRAFLPARGRRLLAFSDSRREAARLGVRLTQQHERQLFRAMVTRNMANGTTDREVAEKIAEMEALIGPMNEAQRAGVKDRMQSQHSPLTVDALAARIAPRDWGEFYEPEFAAKWSAEHDADKWNGEAWEKNERAVKEYALQYFGREFAAPAPTRNSLETIGLAEIVYPGADRESWTFPNDIAAFLHMAGRDVTTDVLDVFGAAWPAFVSFLLDTVRQEGSVTLGKGYEADMAMNLAVPVGLWAMETTTLDSRVRFVGATARQKRRRFAEMVLRRCGFFPSAPANDEAVQNVAAELLRRTWAFLCERAADAATPWLERRDMDAGDGALGVGLRLILPLLALQAPQAIYQSARTGLLFPRMVAGVAPEQGCDDLRLVSPADLDADARYGRLRREYRDNQTFTGGLWASEHSAQLSSGENRKLQDLFKVGVRNALSATTTLELGIDIGGLNLALLGNVPPGKANYLQRAGRAGRRADGSSLVLTFARPRPYDRAVFADFGKFLGRELRRPTVRMDRERLALRHAQAFLLGEFFRRKNEAVGIKRTGAMVAFGRMGVFYGFEEKPPFWEGGGAPKPPLAPQRADYYAHEFKKFLLNLHDHGSVEEPGLMAQLSDLLAGTPHAALLADRHAFFAGIIARYDDALAGWLSIWKPLRDEWNGLEETERRRGLALLYQMREVWETSVIEALAERQFLPRYGFPIGLQSLKVRTPETVKKDTDSGEMRRVRVRDNPAFKLERDGLTAVGEYVPGSRLMVGGQIIHSRGLLKHWSGDPAQGQNDPFGLSGQMNVCPKQHRYYALGGAGAALTCPVCHERPNGQTKHLLIPAHGYVTAAWDPPKRHGALDSVGYAQPLTLAFQADGGTNRRRRTDFGGVRGLTALYQSDGEILVFNDGENNGFAICHQCGYADVEKQYAPGRKFEGRLDLPSGFASHAPLDNPNPKSVCWAEGTSPVLRKRTLAARVTTDVVQINLQATSVVATTLSLALRQAGAALLELDPRELGALIVPTGEGADIYGPVIYDNVPGGAGHTAELFAQGREWLDEARRTLFVNAEHHARCGAACLDCVLTYEGQRAHEQGLLDRRSALTFLKDLLDAAAVPDTEDENTGGGGEGSGGRNHVTPPSRPSSDENMVTEETPGAQERRARLEAAHAARAARTESNGAG